MPQQINPLAALTNWEKGAFLPVGDSYGGYQGWLHTELAADRAVPKFYADRACGVVAATNVAVYLAEHHLNKAMLARKHCKDRTHFAEEMKELYHYVIPRIWGIPFLYSLAVGFERFARSRGGDVTFRCYRLSWWRRHVEEIAKWIATGLRKDTPVLLLTWNMVDPKLKDFRYHWITITAIYQKENEYYIVASNWGMQKIYNLSCWVKSRSLYQGLIYFE